MNLSKRDTITSYESMIQNLQYTLSLDANFAPFLVDQETWGKKTNTSPLRDLRDDGDDTPGMKLSSLYYLRTTQMYLILIMI